jgi:hypothetical protein
MYDFLRRRAQRLFTTASSSFSCSQAKSKSSVIAAAGRLEPYEPPAPLPPAALLPPMPGRGGIGMPGTVPAPPPLPCMGIGMGGMRGGGIDDDDDAADNEPRRDGRAEGAAEDEAEPAAETDSEAG